MTLMTETDRRARRQARLSTAIWKASVYRDHRYYRTGEW